MPAELLPLAILLAIAPGYMTIYFATHGRTGRALEPDLRLVLQSLVVSAVLVAIVGPFAYGYLWPLRDHISDHALEVAGWMVAIFLVVPFGAGWASRNIVAWLGGHKGSRITKLFRKVIPEPMPPTLWDWASVNEVADGKFVVIEFVDGRKIGGGYGKPGVALTSPEQPGLFLAVEWHLNEGGVPDWPIPLSAGILVPLDRDVRSIRILAPGTEEARDMNEIDTAEQSRSVIPTKKQAPTLAPQQPAHALQVHPAVSDQYETKEAKPGDTKGVIPAKTEAPTVAPQPQQQPPPAQPPPQTTPKEPSGGKE